MSGLFALLLGLFLLGVVLNAFFAGYETGFVSSNPIRVRHMAEKENDLQAKRLLTYMEHPDRMITVVLLGTNIALVMGTMALTDLVRDPFWATVIATPAFLVFGEVLPKSMFRLHPTRLTLRLLPVIRFFEALLTPLVLPVTWLSQRFLALTEAEQRDIRTMMTSQDDVRVLVDESAHHGSIEPEEKAMIHSVMDLQTRRAKEVMVPRINMCALPETATRLELVAMLKDSGFTRIPIYRESIDQIIGAVNAFSPLTDTDSGNQDIKRFIRPVIHVHDTIRLDDLLTQLRAQKQSMAIVTDEYGGTDGLVTIEDILEEIFGEIQDEHDKEEMRIRKSGRNAYVIDARMPLEDAARFMELPIEDNEVETVAGWIMHAMGRIPNKGEVVDFGRFRATVLEGGPNYVASVRLEVLPTAEANDGTNV